MNLTQLCRKYKCDRTLNGNQYLVVASVKRGTSYCVGISVGPIELSLPGVIRNPPGKLHIDYIQWFQRDRVVKIHLIDFPVYPVGNYSEVVGDES